MRVFITGGAGFIGSHLSDACIVRGDEVTILDNLSTGTLKNLSGVAEKVEFTEGDIRDQALVEKLTQSADVVLHMAAALGVQTIMHHTVESVSTNFTGSEVVMNAALKFDKRLIIASTSEIYGDIQTFPIDELGVPAPKTVYGSSKLAGENYAYSYNVCYGLPTVITRIFNNTHNGRVALGVGTDVAQLRIGEIETH